MLRGGSFHAKLVPLSKHPWNAFGQCGGWSNVEIPMQKVLILSVAALCVMLAAVAGVMASDNKEVVHTIKPQAAPDKSELVAAPAVKAAAKPEEPEPMLKPLGDPSPLAEESAHPLTQATPEALLAGIFLARARGDQAWLARTLESLAGQASLTQDNLATAWRNYLWQPEMWDKLEAAHKQQPAEVFVEGDMARVTFEVGGAAGTMFMLLKRINGAWYLTGA